MPPKANANPSAPTGTSAYAIEVTNPFPAYEYDPSVVVELQLPPDLLPEAEPDPDPESVRSTDAELPDSLAEVDLCKLDSKAVTSLPVAVAVVEVWPTDSSRLELSLPVVGWHWRGL